MSDKATITIGRPLGQVSEPYMNILIKSDCGLVIRGRVTAEDLMLALTGAAEQPFDIAILERGNCQKETQ